MPPLEIFLSSLALVFVNEMGDKTQLIAFSLAARHKKPKTILAGILVASILNHSLAAFVAASLSQYLNPTILKLTVAACFIFFGILTLKAEKESGEEAEKEVKAKSGSVFWITVFFFFLAEMGDKTQLTTAALAAQFSSKFWVPLGSVSAMLLANGPAVYFGNVLSHKLNFGLIKKIASGLFFLFAFLILLEFVFRFI